MASHLLKALLFKVETTYGTDAAPTGTADAVLLRDDVQMAPMTVMYAERNNAKAWFGHNQQLVAADYKTITFSVELAGSGTAGTAPVWGRILRCCGFAETVTAATKVDYDPVTTNVPSATIYFHYDGKRHILRGARGSVRFELSKQQIPYAIFTFTGLKGGTPEADASMPSLTLTGWQQPLVVNNANTPSGTVIVHGQTGAPLYSLSLDMQNQIVYRNLPGVEDVQLVGRSPQGSVVIESPDIAVRNHFANIRSAALAGTSVVHGTAAGNIVELAMPNSQITEPQYGNEDNVVTLGMTLRALPSGATGNNEVRVTAR